MGLEAENWAKRLSGYLLDWGIALGLTVLGFWAFSVWRSPNLPEVAPDWKLSSIQGEEISLSDYRGKTLVLNFWATWCQPCIMEIPTFEKFSNEHPDIPVLGIAVDGTPESLLRFSKQHNMTYPIVIATPEVEKNYQVTTLPMTVIVGPEGEIKNAHVGLMLEQQLKWATN